MFATILAFIASPLGKIAGYIIGGLVAIGLVLAVIKYHDDQVKALAQYQYNQTQLEQTIKDQQSQISKLQQLNNSTNEIIGDLNIQNNDLNKKTDDIDTFLNNSKSNDIVSPVIIETLKKLKGVQ